MLILPLFLLKFDKDRLNYVGIDVKNPGQNILLPVFLSNLQKKMNEREKFIFLFRNFCTRGFNACDSRCIAQNWLIEQSLVHIWGFLILLISGKYRTTFKANNEGTELVSRKILSTRGTKPLCTDRKSDQAI